MKMPKEIKSEHKIRDLGICMLYIDGYLPKEIKEKRNLSISERRIAQIVYENRDFIHSGKDWHKSKRINKLERQLRIKEEKGEVSKKDMTDILEQLRKEIEGDKAGIDLSKHITNITKIELVVSDDTEIPLAQQTGNRLPESE